MRKWIRRNKQKFVLIIVILLVIILALGPLAMFIAM